MDTPHLHRLTLDTIVKHAKLHTVRGEELQFSQINISQK